MQLSQDLERHVAAYTDHQGSIDAVRDWLIEHVQAVSHARLDDPWAEELTDRVWWAVDAYDRQEVDEATLRGMLQRAIPAPTPTGAR